MLSVPIEDLEIRRKAPHLETPGFCFTHFVVRKVSWQESICSRTHPIRNSIYSRGRRKSPTPHPNSDCFHVTSRNKAFALSQGCTMKVYLKLWGVIFRDIQAPAEARPEPGTSPQHRSVRNHPPLLSSRSRRDAVGTKTGVGTWRLDSVNKWTPQALTGYPGTKLSHSMFSIMAKTSGF